MCYSRISLVCPNRTKEMLPHRNPDLNPKECRINSKIFSGLVRYVFTFGVSQDSNLDGQYNIQVYQSLINELIDLDSEIHESKPEEVNSTILHPFGELDDRLQPNKKKFMGEIFGIRKVVIPELKCHVPKYDSMIDWSNALKTEPSYFASLYNPRTKDIIKNRMTVLKLLNHTQAEERPIKVMVEACIEVPG
ncbi:unnamed protein product [Lepeophtheirus salmonis]|uniref:(salmon louse) hypothetical protein n=1 Tax=Lepeophtheirus salmonis TaxID=72036 RepID=A0A7R8CJH0_LEPSM|nr:unnamed protein product [Lepeophtheirus salmonis]CAF2792687.1 unnamed protein product [Lepeophtheirus salmonis]